MAVNNLKDEVMALIVLEASDDYLFVETGDDGEVEHYRPTLVGGEHQHMVAVRTELISNDYPTFKSLIMFLITRYITGEGAILFGSLLTNCSTGGARHHNYQDSNHQSD